MATMAEKSSDDVFQADSTGSSHTGTGAVDEANIEIDAEWTTAEETAIRRKFDLTIVPMVTILCKFLTPFTLYLF